MDRVASTRSTASRQRVPPSVWGQVRQMLREPVEYRELLMSLARRDLLVRYKQTVMGFAWAVCVPLLNTAIFSLIFMRVAPIATSVPYPLFAFAGLLPWNFFASSLKFAVGSLTANAALVGKVYFPRAVLPLAAILVSLVDFAVASLVLIPLMIYYDVAPTPALLFLPVVVVTQLAFTSGLALALSAANLFYRDVKYLLDVGVTVWMFATSVVYPVEMVGGRIGVLLQLNPMTPIIDAYRAVLVHGRLPNALPFGATAVASLVLLLVGWLVFHRAEPRFAEQI